jgi:hypothetical protein
LRPLFAAALLTFSFSTRAAIPPAENLLPADTLFLVSAPDFTAVRTAAKTSPGWLFWNDPAMKPFHDKFMSKWSEQFVAPLERDLGVKISDFAGLPQGQLTFAVTQNGWNGSDDDSQPGLILLLDAKENLGLLQTNIAALQKKWTADGKSIHTETVRGVPFSVIPLASNDVPASISGLLPKHQPVQELGKEPAPEKPGQIVIGQYQSLLIVGNSLKAVEPVVAHLSGGASPALSDSAIFAADKMSQLRDAPLYFGWFNARTFFSILAGMPGPQPNPEAPTLMPRFSPGVVLTASGLAGLKSASFSYRETHDGSQLNVFLSAPESGRQGVLNIVAAATKDANPPAFVPADAVKFSRWRFDGQKSWAELLKIIAGISPQYLGYLNSAIDMANAGAQQKDPSFDLRKNLIANLGDDFINYQKAPVGKSVDDVNNAPSLFLIGSPNADQAVLAIKTVAAMLPGQQNAPEPRDFHGRKIYTIPLPGGAQPDGTTRSLYCAASSGYVALTTDVSAIEEFLRSSDGKIKPLSETAGLADAAQFVGGAGNGIFGYQNQRETMRAAFTLLKNSSGNAPTAPNPLASLPKGISDWMDFSLLPDYDQVAKYFYMSVYGGGANSDGISLKVFAPRPPQLN